jgi:hypothetical protein
MLYMPPTRRPLSTPVPVAAKPGHASEAVDVRRIREHRISVGGIEHRIVRGDFHRHTELSTGIGVGRWCSLRLQEAGSGMAESAAEQGGKVLSTRSSPIVFAVGAV